MTRKSRQRLFEHAQRLLERHAGPVVGDEPLAGIDTIGWLIERGIDGNLARARVEKYKERERGRALGLSRRNRYG